MTGRFRNPVTGFLLALTLFTATGCGGSPGVEISLPPEPQVTGRVYIGGSVTNPGYYPLGEGDSLESLTQAAGGVAPGADLNEIKLYIPPAGKLSEPQKIDINRAEAWLIQVLPGIGEMLAERIVSYRERNGAFRSVNELLKVEGIGETTLAKIQGMITVSD